MPPAGAIVIFGFGETSDCPAVVYDVEVDTDEHDELTITIDVALDTGDSCTTDDISRSFVVRVDGVNAPVARVELGERGRAQLLPAGVRSQAEMTAGRVGPLIVGPFTEFVEAMEIVVSADFSGECASVHEVENGFIWPAGTRWDQSAEAAVLPDGQVVRDGDTISGGGGANAAQSNLPTLINAVAACGWDPAQQTLWLQTAGE